jgi:hypothetical protein
MSLNRKKRKVLRRNKCLGECGNDYKTIAQGRGKDNGKYMPQKWKHLKCRV